MLGWTCHSWTPHVHLVHLTDSLLRISGWYIVKMFVSLSKWTHECYYGWQTPNQATNHFSQHPMYMVPTHQEVESLSPPSESGLTYELTYFDQQKVVEMMFILGLWTQVLGELATSAYSFYVEVWLPWNHHAVRKSEPDPERDDTEEHGGRDMRVSLLGPSGPVQHSQQLRAAKWVVPCDATWSKRIIQPSTAQIT